MSEENNKITGQKIEDAINEILNGDAKIQALDFVAYLRSNELPPVQTSWSENAWDVNYMNDGICILYLDGAAQAPGPWTIWSHAHCDYSGEHENVPMDKDVHVITWVHVNICKNFTSNGELAGAAANRETIKRYSGKNSIMSVIPLWPLQILMQKH